MAHPDEVFTSNLSQNQPYDLLEDLNLVLIASA